MKSKKYLLLIAMISILLLITACGNKESKTSGTASSGKDKLKVVHIGFQKGNTLNILKAKGSLDKRLEKEGIKVEWSTFPTGTALLEALNAGSIDFGHASDGNGVFAQAGGKPLIYVASESPYPKGVAIVVPENSPINSVKDLKGKKVAVTQGGNQHYLLAKALENAGLKYEDVQPIFYKDAAEGGVAFKSGKIDALGIWDPFLAVIQNDVKLKFIVDGEGLTENRTYYYGSENFTKKHPEIIKIVLDELEKSDQWANDNPTEVASLLSKDLGIDQKALEIATQRRHYGVLKVDEKAIKSQQELADTFYNLKLMPKKINVKDVVKKNPKWYPSSIK